MTDHELLTLFAISQDAHAFSEIVRRYESLVFRVCFRKLRNAADAADATQQVFAGLWQTKPIIHTSLRAWIVRCAINVSISQIRKNASRRRRETQSEAKRTSDICDVEQRETHNIVRQIWHQLEHLDQQVIQHIIVDDQPQSLLAEQLGISQQAVAKRKHKILSHMRRALLSRGITTLTLGLTALLRRTSQAASVIGEKINGVPISAQTVTVGCLITGLLLTPTQSISTAYTDGPANYAGPVGRDDATSSVVLAEASPVLANSAFSASLGRFQTIDKSSVAENTAILQPRSILYDAGASLLGQDSEASKSSYASQQHSRALSSSVPEPANSGAHTMAGTSIVSDDSSAGTASTPDISMESVNSDPAPSRWLDAHQKARFIAPRSPLPLPFTFSSATANPLPRDPHGLFMLMIHGPPFRPDYGINVVNADRVAMTSDLFPLSSDQPVSSPLIAGKDVLPAVSDIFQPNMTSFVDIAQIPSVPFLPISQCLADGILPQLPIEPSQPPVQVCLFLATPVPEPGSAALLCFAVLASFISSRTFSRNAK